MAFKILVEAQDTGGLREGVTFTTLDRSTHRLVKPCADVHTATDILFSGPFLTLVILQTRQRGACNTRTPSSFSIQADRGLGGL